MSSSILEAIESRQDAAARKARASAVHLAEGDSPDLKSQLDFEDSLDLVARYSRMREDVREVAEDFEPYGRRSGNSISILRDLTRAQQGVEVARNRLASHQRAATGSELPGIERRDIGSSSTFASVPGWLTGDPAPTSINNAPLLTYAKPLPLHTANDIRLVGFGTNPSAAMQSATNTAISNADPVDLTVTLPIRTAVGSITMPLQFLDGQAQPGLDQQIIPRLVDATAAACDSSLINGDNTGGSVLGLRGATLEEELLQG